MTTLLVRCDNCGAEPRYDATLTTLTVNPTDDRTVLVYGCPLCGATSSRQIPNSDVQAMLLDAGCQLAVMEG